MFPVNAATVQRWRAQSELIAICCINIRLTLLTKWIQSGILGNKRDEFYINVNINYRAHWPHQPQLDWRKGVHILFSPPKVILNQLKSVKLTKDLKASSQPLSERKLETSLSSKLMRTNATPYSIFEPTSLTAPCRFVLFNLLLDPL